MDLIYDCKHVLEDGSPCEKRNKFLNFSDLPSVQCKKCAQGKPLFISDSLRKKKVVDDCPVCRKKDFYTQRDFPQQAGCLIVLAGACLVPWTYGLSLAVVAILDFILYKSLPDATICYHCLSRIRGAAPNPQHKPFDHNLFEHYMKEDEKGKSL